MTTPARAEEARDYADRSTYDWAEAYFRANSSNRPDVPNDVGGNLAWGQSYVLRSFISMYHGYRDTHYLDLLVDNVDAILSTRDSVRGVADYRGLSLPAWRGYHPYTAGWADIPDAEGRPSLRVRAATTYVNGLSVTTSAGTAAGTFKVTIVDPRINVTNTFDNLTMDPTSPDYAVRRIHAASPTSTRATAVDLRPTPEAAGAPAPGTYQMNSTYYIFSVHTGMITAPIAEFSRIVRRNPALARRFASKAAQYVEAVEEAIAVHDGEWRQNSDGEGWYIWERGATVAFDGTEMPHNQFLALATTQLHLAAVTKDEKYRDRARRMLTTFRNDLRVQDASYIWNYWWTKSAVFTGYSQTDDLSDFTPAFNGAKQIEDMSHGAVDVEAAVQGFRDGLVFTADDIRRLAATFTDNIATYDAAGNPTVFTRVDGVGPIGAQDVQAPRWMALADWDDEVFTFCRQMYNHRQIAPTTGSNLLGVANIAAQAAIRAR